MYPEQTRDFKRLSLGGYGSLRYIKSIWVERPHPGDHIQETTSRGFTYHPGLPTPGEPSVNVAICGENGLTASRKVYRRSPHSLSYKILLTRAQGNHLGTSYRNSHSKIALRPYRSLGGAAESGEAAGAWLLLIYTSTIAAMRRTMGCGDTQRAFRRPPDFDALPRRRGVERCLSC